MTPEDSEPPPVLRVLGIYTSNLSPLSSMKFIRCLSKVIQGECALAAQSQWQVWAPRVRVCVQYRGGGPEGEGGHGESIHASTVQHSPRTSIAALRSHARLPVPL